MEAANLSLKITTEGMAEAKSGMEGLSNTAAMLERAFTAVVAAIGLYKLAGAIEQTALLAARYDTLGIAMSTAGLNAGFTAVQMAGLQSKMEDTGISMLAARQSLVMMAAAQMDLGKSAQLARVAQDVAIVAGLNSSQAFETLTQSIQTGQAIIAHHMGLMVNYAGAEERLAKALGKTKDQLTDSEKVQARMNEVMRLGAGYQGLYEASMTTAGKQMKSMERYVENLQVKVGALFQPALSAGVEFFTAALKDLAAWMDKVSKSGDLQKVAGALGSFTAGGLEAAVAPIKMMIEYSKQLKDATLAIGAAALFAYGNQWIPALAATIAPTLRAVTLVVSLELATIQYATSTGVASLALAGFRVAMTALLSPMGMITIGLTALYFATKSIREETERLNEANEKQERFINGVQKPILGLASDASSLRKQRKALLDDGGIPGAHTHQFQVDELVKSTTQGMDNITPEWAASARMYAEQVIRAREALEDTKNKILQQQQATEAAAKAAQALADAQTKYKEQLAQTMDRHMTEGTVVSAWEREQIDLMTKKLGIQKQSFDLYDAMVKISTTSKMVPGDLLNGPKSSSDSLNFNPVEDATTAYLKSLKELAGSGDTWAIIGQTVVETSSYAADALTRWSNNLDGLGVSWTSLGTTVRNVLADMVRQMERVIIEQKLMQPLMNGLGLAMDTIGDGKGWSSWASAFSSAFGGGKATGGSVYGGTTYLVGEQGPELFTPGASGAITPNHALGGGAPTIVNNISVSVTDGKVSTSADAGKNGEEIAKSVKGLINQWAQEQSRSGGVLARQ